MIAVQECRIMDQAVLLRIGGAVEQPLDLLYEDLAGLPEEDQVRDVARFHPGRQGDGVWLEALLRRARPRAEANYLTLHADRDDFHVSIPLAAVRGEGVVVFRKGAERLGADQGGPVRFLIRDPAACHTDELDDCANVKYLSRIELTVRRGRDTRPADEGAHAALHQSQSARSEAIRSDSSRTAMTDD
jgi:DMSO/TMAO reductase YedYZ molybdopterin-dependent catalytic subunit